MRDSVLIPHRWAKSLASLDDATFRRVVEAIFDYSDSGTDPGFDGILGAFWAEIAAAKMMIGNAVCPDLARVLVLATLAA